MVEGCYDFQRKICIFYSLKPVAQICGFTTSERNLPLAAPVTTLHLYLILIYKLPDTNVTYFQLVG